jgi:integrase
MSNSVAPGWPSLTCSDGDLITHTKRLRADVGTRDEALLTLALKTGMRQGELAALRWEDIDLTDKPSIVVWRSADTRTRTRVSTTKTGKDRRIHIGPRTVDVLKGHRARQLEERMAAASWMDPGLVFPNTKGKIRRRDSVMRSGDFSRRPAFR